MSLTFAQPTDWWLEIPSELQTHCWQASQTLASPARRQAFYLNQLCLQVFLPWFQQEYAPETSLWTDRHHLPSIWDLVDGSGLTVGPKRIVILPMDTLDTDGVDIPQEWVDIPSWVADYYLAIQVDLENGWLRVWGYTTHREITRHGEYDPCDRTYGLSSQVLKRDLNAFWATCQLCPDADTQTGVPSLPTLSEPQAHQTVQYLSQLDSLFPRLALPFELWGAFCASDDWRQQLYQSRLNAAQLNSSEPEREVTIPDTRLSRWLQNLFADEWLPLESLLESGHPALAHNLRRSEQVKGFCAPRVKFITLNAADIQPQTVALLMVLNSEADGRMGIRVQVHPASADRYVPTDLMLAIYSQDDEMLQSVQARDQSDYMRLPHFRCQPGTQFRLQITLSDDTFSETFAV